jgi:hypothetical protein
VVLALVQKLSGKMSFSMVGTIVSANRISCYVAVKRDLIYKDALYHIVLADGSTMDLSSSDFSDPVEEGYLTGFTIKHCDLEYDLNQLAAVELSRDVSMLQLVHLCDFFNGNWIFTGGQVK